MPSCPWSWSAVKAVAADNLLQRKRYFQGSYGQTADEEPKSRITVHGNTLIYLSGIPAITHTLINSSYGKSNAVVVLVQCDGDDIYKGCGDSIQCAEENLVKVVDEFDSQPSIQLIGDYVSLEKTNGDDSTPKGEEGIFDRIIRYMGQHEIKIKLSSPDEARSAMEESRKKKLRKWFMPLLLLLKLKGLVIIPAVLFVIALVAFKGMGAGLMALLISGAVALKQLLDTRHSSSSVSYEILPQIAGPHWSRSDALNTLLQSYQ
ncbi:uncharacterized protein LOC116175546 [Photinus pyralis]|uniref:uncharacterized protein LOC116175546 n=1 Tax=Photinus pyralis TaxID=7054 RepID=UPI00126772A8|nr:uncharacterized protein LOC116175546 [Photinus pyralis]